jgi:hypothetical protein
MMNYLDAMRIHSRSVKLQAINGFRSFANDVENNEDYVRRMFMVHGNYILLEVCETLCVPYEYLYDNSYCMHPTVAIYTHGVKAIPQMLREAANKLEREIEWK